MAASLLEMLANRWLKTMPDGRRVYFPHGTYRQGYLVVSTDDEYRIRKFSTVLVVGMLISAGVASALWRYSFPSAISLVVVTLVATFLVPNYLKRGLQPCSDKLSFMEAMNSQALIIPGWFVRLALVGCSVAVAFFIWVLWSMPNLWPYAVPMLVVFGLLGSLYIWMIFVRRRVKKPMAR